jgi:hypothetical protein
VVQELRKAKANATGTLVKRGGYLTEQVSDEFEIEVNGERMTVTRAQIEEA